MGISCKPLGKLGSMLAKDKHLKEKEHKDANQAKAKKSRKEKNED